MDEISEAEPLAPFQRWLDEAWQGEPNAHAMTLATATPEGRPSARAVLLKGLDERGFVFYTNLESRKVEECSPTRTPRLCFLWKSLNRQVRVEGVVELVTDEEANAYFASRPRDSQIGAWASDQSQPLAGRAELERRVDECRTALCRGRGAPAAAIGPAFGSCRIASNSGRNGRFGCMIGCCSFAKAYGWRRERLFP